MAIVIVLAPMIVAYFVPGGPAPAGDGRERHRGIRKRRCRGLGRVQAAGAPGGRALEAVAGGLVVAAVFLMVTKPGL